MTDAQESRVYGLWFGGSSYGTPDMKLHLEEFPNLENAKNALLDRYAVGHWTGQDFLYVNQEYVRTFTPAVDESSQMLIYLYNPTHERDAYPDRCLTLVFNSEDEACVLDESC